MLQSGARLVKLSEKCTFCWIRNHVKNHDGYVVEGKAGTFCSICDGSQLRGGRVRDTADSGRTTGGGIGPAQRARILMRDRHCVLCGRQDSLQIGHLLSMAAGLRAGLSESQLDSDENLAALCPACNLGIEDVAMPLWVVVPLLRARTQQMKGKK